MAQLQFSFSQRRSATIRTLAILSLASRIDGTVNLTKGQQIAEFAVSFVGYDFVYGGTSPEEGFDASGLVTYVYREFGYIIPRTPPAMFRSIDVYIEKASLEPGDLVFFSENENNHINNVGMYIGNNEFVHASRPGVGVIISRLDTEYYSKAWVGAIRVLSE